MLIDRYAIGEIPYGYCHCGCGRKTTTVTMTSAKKGIVKGQPYKFILGHRRPRFSIAERFWKYVDKSGGPDACWEWITSRNPDGYGIFRINAHHKSHSVGAHIISYEIAYGQLPDGTEVCHTCNNRACQNPAHLYAGTHKQNVHDAIDAGHFHPPAPLYGQDHPGAKLTTDNVHAIRTRHACGDVTMTQLSVEFGVSVATISNIINNKRWQTVP